MDENLINVLVIDDEKSMLEMMEIVLAKENCSIVTTPDPIKGLELVKTNDFDVIIQDLKMPKMGGLELLEKIKNLHPKTPVIIITAFSTWDNAVEAMRLGAFDYIKKPFDTDNIRAVVTRAAQQKRSIDESEELSLVDVKEIVGSSKPMQQVLSTVRRIAATDSTIVIMGESGTGKELIARALHYNSMRSKGSFIAINCGAITETLLESELFGHVRGAFTGAIADKKGLFEIADGGTLFLDEIGEMSSSTQVKLLRVLENREFIPVGGVKTKQVNIRLIVATNRQLEEEVASGRFREDLYYRLNVIPINIPSLRERKEDIPLLAGHFLAIYSEAMNKNVTTISDQAREDLVGHDWPGNVRELENVIQRAVVLCEGDTIKFFSLHARKWQPDMADEEILIPESGIDLDEKIANIERKYIKRALHMTQGHITLAADILGITFRSLRYKMKKLEIEP